MLLHETRFCSAEFFPESSPDSRAAFSSLSLPIKLRDDAVAVIRGRSHPNVAAADEDQRFETILQNSLWLNPDGQTLALIMAVLDNAHSNPHDLIFQARDLLG